MYSNQYLLFRIDLAFDQREMCRVSDLVGVGDQLHFTISRHDGTLSGTFDKRLILITVLDEVCDRTDFELMFLSELHEIRESSHAAIIVQYLANDGSRFQSGKSG